MSAVGHTLNFRGGPFDGQCHLLPLGKRGTLPFRAKGQEGHYEIGKDLEPASAHFLHWIPALQKAA